MTFEKWAAIIALVATIPTYKGWFVLFLQWSKNKKLKSLEAQLQHYEMLKNDSGYFICWVSQGVLIVLAFIAAALMFEAVAIDPKGAKLSSGFISLMASIAYITATYKLGQVNRLKNYEKTIRSLNNSIAKLKA